MMQANKPQRIKLLLYQKMNLIKCSSKAAQDAHDLIKIRIKERFYHYKSRTVPRIATLLDPRFKKEGFFYHRMLNKLLRLWS